MPTLKESDFKKHIALNKFERFYMIYGEEKLLVKRYTDLLTERIAGKSPLQFNYHTFDDGLDLQEFAVAVAVAPFVCEYNCVKVTDCDVRNFKKDDFECLTDILNTVPNSSVVIFSFPTLEYDAKKAGNIDKLLKFISKNGIAVNMERQGTIQLERTLVKWAGECGAILNQINAAKIIERCGKDLNLLHNEILKLSAFADGKEITIEMIENMVTKNLEARVFDLVDDIIYRKSDDAFRKLSILFYQKEDPIAVVSALSLSYIDMYRIRVAMESGVPLTVLKDNFQTYKSREWVLQKTKQKITKISTQSLRKSIDELLDVDIIFKSSSINREVYLEKLVAKLILLAGE